MSPASPADASENELDVLAVQTDRLVATARTLTDCAGESLCVGWTRAHVLAHLSLNAEGLARLVRAAVDGSGETMYAGSAQRDADIEARAMMSPSELTRLLEDTSAALARQLARLGPEHAQVRVERVPGGMTFTAGSLARRRLVEVVYHHVDLDAGFGFADLDDGLLDRFLHQEVEAASSADHDGRARALLRLARARDPR
jgi:maleylpyruvate isomerase